MSSSEKLRDGTLNVTADDGAKLTIAPASQAVQDAAVLAFLANHVVVVPLPSDDPQIIAALQGVTLVKALKWLINKRILTLDDLV